jgi:hypothetical protein
VRVNISTKFPFACSIACLLCGCLLVAPLRITLLPPLLSRIARSCYKNWARLLVLWWNSFKFLLQSRLLLHSLGGFFSSGVDFVAHLMALPFTRVSQKWRIVPPLSIPQVVAHLMALPFTRVSQKWRIVAPLSIPQVIFINTWWLAHQIYKRRSRGDFVAKRVKMPSCVRQQTTCPYNPTTCPYNLDSQTWCFGVGLQVTEVPVRKMGDAPGHDGDASAAAPDGQ